MKKDYLLIVGILILLLVCGYFGVQKFLGKSGEAVIDNNNINLANKNNDSLHLNNTNGIRVKLKKAQNPISKKIENSIIEIQNHNNVLTGRIDLFEENPFLQDKLGNNEISAFKGDNEYSIIETHLDRNIIYRTLNNEILPEFIAIAFTAKSINFKESSSYIKIFDKNGKSIYDSGIIYNRNYINPTVSPNGKFLAVYSSIYEDAFENYHLTDQNKIEFWDLISEQEIKINNENLNLDLPQGKFNEYNLFVGSTGYNISIVDLAESNFFNGKRDPGYIISALKEEGEFKIIATHFQDSNKVNITNNFKKIYFN